MKRRKLKEGEKEARGEDNKRSSKSEKSHKIKYRRILKLVSEEWMDKRGKKRKQNRSTLKTD